MSSVREQKCVLSCCAADLELNSRIRIGEFARFLCGWTPRLRSSYSDSLDCQHVRMSEQCWFDMAMVSLAKTTPISFGFSKQLSVLLSQTD